LQRHIDQLPVNQPKPVLKLVQPRSSWSVINVLLVSLLHHHKYHARLPFPHCSELPGILGRICTWVPTAKLICNLLTNNFLWLTVCVILYDLVVCIWGSNLLLVTYSCQFDK
jgi:hypothetical protein